MIKEEIFIKKLEDFTAFYPKLIDLSLKRVLNLLEKLGNPHLNLPPVIHVAGTNGKGSTIAFIANALKNNNKKIHIYTSPHLVSIKERIVINNKQVSLEELLNTLEFCAKVNNQNPITQFEMLTVIAFYMMSKTPADVAIIETGLGGKLDATNVIVKPMLTIITSVSYDHMEFLGDKIELIAKEKAGIMKKDVLCISAPQEYNIEKVLKKEAKKIGAKVLLYDKDWKLLKSSKSYCIKYLGKNFYFSEPFMKGNHQIKNSALALMALLCCKNLKLSFENVKRGINNTKWPGRLEKINSGKIMDLVHDSSEVWLDGGHNISAANAISKWINLYNTSNKSVILICGFLKNKDAKNIISILDNEINRIIFVPIADTKNFYSNNYLLDIASSLNILCSSSESLFLAISSLKDFKNSIILIFGSLYLIGEAYKINNN